ncbi:E3 ubiquitin-protein ligase NEURL3 isoform X2 [Phyllostomus hastatus]|uniref:E3 ubiquitin-protein ligase NEURL3 isoform X2 n=1 Tax=Phyllostomus hastatus TaxID=9423 RepID=UPI001E6843F4|nr:E3 ubiquitin-protein ligase NEURL3 isoform X2 [Phyllostomus hastatus]
MGAQLCSQADTEEPLETLRFHPEAKGAHVILDAKRITAYRLATFHDGIVFSQRPVRPGERVALRVLGHEGGWHGGLRVGFTRLNPACVEAPSLPPFVCPDLEQQSPTWAALLPDDCALAGDIVSFWVNRHGRLCAQVNRGPRLLLRKGVPMGAPLWAVMDVYGTTKAIELLGLSPPSLSQIPQPVPSPEPRPGPSLRRRPLTLKPQQERSVPSVSTVLPTPALSPVATHTSAAAAPGGSSGTQPSALCVAVRLRG